MQKGGKSALDSYLRNIHAQDVQSGEKRINAENPRCLGVLIQQGNSLRYTGRFGVFKFS